VLGLLCESAVCVLGRADHHSFVLKRQL